MCWTISIMIHWQLALSTAQKKPNQTSNETTFSAQEPVRMIITARYIKIKNLLRSEKIYTDRSAPLDWAAGWRKLTPNINSFKMLMYFFYSAAVCQAAYFKVFLWVPKNWVHSSRSVTSSWISTDGSIFILILLKINISVMYKTNQIKNNMILQAQQIYII